MVVGQWRSGDEVLQLCSGVVEVEEIREYIGERERERERERRSVEWGRTRLQREGFISRAIPRVLHGVQ